MDSFYQGESVAPRWGEPGESAHRFLEYAGAYWTAAQALAQHAARGMKNPPNYEDFPIGFLYRHTLELAVKGLLVEHGGPHGCHKCGGLGDEQKWREWGEEQRSKWYEEYIFKKSHRLSEMVPDLEHMNASFEFAFEEAATKADCDFIKLKALLEKWDKWDAKAVNFRYGVTKDGKVTVPKDFVLDVQAFSQEMNSAIEYIFAVDEEIIKEKYQEIVSGDVGDRHP